MDNIKDDFLCDDIKMKQIILLNGPSSSGKSTLAKSLKDLIKEKINQNYEIVSIDDFMKISTSETIYEDDVFEISQDMCDAVNSLMRKADGVLVDHVITSERIFDQFIKSVQPYNFLLIHVTCPLNVLLKREKERGNRCLGSAKNSYDYLYPKEGYDCEIDTSIFSKEECALKIYNLVINN